MVTILMVSVFIPSMESYVGLKKKIGSKTYFISVGSQLIAIQIRRPDLPWQMQ